MSFFPFSATTKIVRFAAVFMMPLAHKISFEAHRLGVFAILTPHHFHNICGWLETVAYHTAVNRV
jgi:hypothetical protein